MFSTFLYSLNLISSSFINESLPILLGYLFAWIDTYKIFDFLLIIFNRFFISDTLSFDKDVQDEDLPEGGHNYIAGFWGDSGVNGYDINGSGITYEDIKTGFIPFLVGKTYAQLSSYDGYEVTINGTTKVYDDTVFAIDPNEFAEDMEGVLFHGEDQVTLDEFNGASVSTNNILRMLIPLMEYHAANNI